jgi:hypothetical protein
MPAIRASLERASRLAPERRAYMVGFRLGLTTRKRQHGLPGGFNGFRSRVLRRGSHTRFELPVPSVA